ncbi:MAG: PepSY domain-containing protein [Clostridia bacterium]|nr:PepSY domain-containing protein [Clostridia bacterium]
MKKLVAMILAVLMMVGCVSAFAAEGTLTKEEAVKTALEFAGVKEDQVTFLNVHRDLDDGREVFEIKFVANKVEYEMNVDIRTGRVFDADRDYYDWDDFDDRYEDFDEVWDDFFFDFD